MSLDQVRELEELAANAWPAGEVEELDGWRLRFNAGVTRRANSVWPNAAGDCLPLAEKSTAWMPSRSSPTRICSWSVFTSQTQTVPTLLPPAAMR